MSLLRDLEPGRGASGRRLGLRRTRIGRLGAGLREDGGGREGEQREE